MYTTLLPGGGECFMPAEKRRIILRDMTTRDSDSSLLPIIIILFSSPITEDIYIAKAWGARLRPRGPTSRW
jgi:hypothetical protein